MKRSKRKAKRSNRNLLRIAFTESRQARPQRTGHHLIASGYKNWTRAVVTVSGTGRQQGADRGREGGRVDSRLNFSWSDIPAWSPRRKQSDCKGNGTVRAEWHSKGYPVVEGGPDYEQQCEQEAGVTARLGPRSRSSVDWNRNAHEHGTPVELICPIFQFCRVFKCNVELERLIYFRLFRQ